MMLQKGTMMAQIHTIQIKDITIGEGAPKICVPIVGRTVDEILAQAAEIVKSPADIVEWRADWYDDADDTALTAITAKKLRTALKDVPLLFTFRTANEGGRRPITPGDYERLNTAMIKSDCFDLIDVEAFCGDAPASRLIEAAHRAHVAVIASNHDFEKTPPKDELVRRLCKMQALGADIPKIAVMPRTKQDVLTLLDATVQMHELYADRPIITMSMAGTGAISRLIGEFSGSAVTFGAVGTVSAPGQLEVGALHHVLDIVHGCFSFSKS